MACKCQWWRMKINYFIHSNIGLLLLIISVSSSYWQSYEVKILSTKGHSGLFKECRTVGNYSRCISLDAAGMLSTDQFKACVAMMLLALISEVFVTILGLVCYFKCVKVLNKVVLALHITALVCGVIGLILYGHEVSTKSDSLKIRLEWGFTLGCVGAGHTFLSLLMLIPILTNVGGLEKDKKEC